MTACRAAIAVDDQRDLAVESMYEYGSRAGIWRMFRVFDAAGISVTFFGSAVALERNPGGCGRNWCGAAMKLPGTAFAGATITMNQG